MKTEEQIQSSINKVVDNIEPNFQKAWEQFESGDYNECTETLFTLIVNLAALEAAQRIID